MHQVVSHGWTTVGTLIYQWLRKHGALTRVRNDSHCTAFTIVIRTITGCSITAIIAGGHVDNIEHLKRERCRGFSGQSMSEPGELARVMFCRRIDG
jgi:hypothetical protein